jgi:hypothetical protein
MKHVLSMTVIAAALLIPSPAAGHHGYASFDKSAEVTLQGTVTDFHFTNPHSVVEFEVSEGGKPQKWQVELGSRLHLTLKGWTATTLEAGNQVTIKGFRAKSGARALWGTKILDGKGKELKVEGEN